MPLFRLSNELVFPPAQFARQDGLLCVGGDLSAERLILAYKNGIFPWFSDEDPLLWWSPDPRLVLFPDQIHISKSLQKTIRKKHYTIRINTDFEQTIRACSAPREGQELGTWIVKEMIDAYITLHEMGVAHSVEVWKDNTLAGGLYGLNIGASFFGESMFSREKDASKVALVGLCTLLKQNRFDLIDCQVTSDHLIRMGAVEIPRLKFLNIIRRSVTKTPDTNLWENNPSICLNN